MSRLLQKVSFFHNYFTDINFLAEKLQTQCYLDVQEVTLNPNISILHTDI